MFTVQLHYLKWYVTVVYAEYIRKEGDQMSIYESIKEYYSNIEYIIITNEDIENKIERSNKNVKQWSNKSFFRR